MDTAFEKQSYMDHALIWSGGIGGEENAECVVPDSMPDLGVIVDADAVVSLRSKELVNGRLNVQADIAVKILYQPEGESTLRNLSLSMSSALTAPATAEDDCVARVHLRVRSVEGKVVNSRKAAVRVELAGMGYCYRKQKLELICGISACDCAVETLQERQSGYRISDVREKTFVVTDDLALPAGISDVDSILTQRVALQLDETDIAGDKLVFRGRAIAFLLLRQEERVYPCSYETAFSQIMEISGENTPTPEVSLMLTGAYFDLPDHSGGKIGLELHLLAQVVCRSETEFVYLADAYSNQRRLDCDYSENALCASERLFSLSHSTGCTAELPHGVSEVLYVKGSVGSANIAGEGVEISIHLRAVYRCEDGSFAGVSRRVQETLPLDAEDGEVVQILSASITGTGSSLTAGGLELRAGVSIRLQAQKLFTLRHLSALSVAEEPLPDSPSLTLLHCGGENELWSLAKAHRSTRAAILDANGGRCDGLLLIPKCR